MALRDFSWLSSEDILTAEAGASASFFCGVGSLVSAVLVLCSLLLSIELLLDRLLLQPL